MYHRRICGTCVGVRRRGKPRPLRVAGSVQSVENDTKRGPEVYLDGVQIHRLKDLERFHAWLGRVIAWRKVAR